MDAVHYKGFVIVVKVEIERETENKFKVTCQIHRNPEKAPVMWNWLAVREFASEQAAYEFGLQKRGRGSMNTNDEIKLNSNLVTYGQTERFARPHIAKPKSFTRASRQRRSACS